MERIEKANKIIATFMGEEVIGNDTIYVQNNMFGNGTGTLNPIRYHESWDWLMPVIQKIKDLGLEDEGSFHEQNDILDAVLALDISRAHEEVAKFVDWYNHQKEEQPEVYTENEKNFKAVLAKNQIARQIKSGKISKNQQLVTALWDIEEALGMRNQPSVQDILTSEEDI